MQRRTTVTATAFTLAGALALSACGDGDDDTPTAVSRGEITIWYSNNEAEVAWGEQMVEAWNADNPDEQISAQEIPAGSSSEEVISAAITAGNAPCLIFNTAPVAVPDFEKQGGLVSLSSFDDGDAYIEERTGAAAEQYKSENGEYFQLPWKANPVMIFYNKEIFEEAGLDPENPPLATHEEFLETARTLVDSGAVDHAIRPAPTSEFFQSWFDFYPLYAAETGGRLLVDDNQATFADAAGITVAEFWKTLYDEELASREQYQGDPFAEGASAMAIVGPWAIAVYGEDVDWGAVPVPTSQGTSPEETYTFSDAKNIGLYTACEHPDTAWDVLKFATSEEQDGELLEMTGQMPLRQDLPGTYPDFFADNPAYETFGDQVSRTVEVPNVPNSVAIWQAFRDTYSRAVIFGEQDVADALSSASDEINTLANEQ